MEWGLFMARKRQSMTAKRGNKSRKPQSQAKSPWWRKPLVWIGGLATLLAGGAATAFGTGLGGSLFSAVHDTPSNAAAVAGGTHSIAAAYLTGYCWGGDRDGYRVLTVCTYTVAYRPDELVYAR